MSAPSNDAGARPGRRRLLALGALAPLAALLPGCALLKQSVVDVASFGAWPSGRRAGAYAFDRLPSHLMDRKLFPFETIRPTGQADPMGDKAFDHDDDEDDDACATPAAAEAGLPPEAAISLEALRRTLSPSSPFLPAQD